MALRNDIRYRVSLGTRLRFLLRLLAITGVVAAAVGALMLAPLWSAVSLEQFQAALGGEQGPTPQVAAGLIAGAAAAIALWLLVELLAALRTSAGARSALGVNATFQTLLATAILLAVNVYSFQHYARFDLTREGKFTLPAEQVAQLRELRSETEIVVFLRQPRAGTALSPEKDEFEAEAERKVVEKVLDLVELFREIGPRFRVTVLDGEKVQQFKRQFNELTQGKPQLREAILAAPNNSIFFHADGKVQRLGFEEFYQLDKTASLARGNLVLQPRGVESFVRRVLAIEEKRPRVALGVVHDLLTTRPNDFDFYTHAGLRKSLEANGFEVVDVILKKWDAQIEPAAYSPDEYRVEETREDLDTAQSALRELAAEREDIQEAAKLFAQPTREFRELFQRRFRRELTAQEAQRQVEAMQEDLKRLDDRMAELRKDAQKLQTTLEKLEGDDRIAEARRRTEVKPKLSKLLESCDLLILPRSTWQNIPEGSYIPPRAHALTDAREPDAAASAGSQQVDVIREFMKRGKPVLACLGPNFENPFDRGGVRQLPPGYAPLSGALTRPLDGVERLLGELGIELGQQMILYDEELKAFTAARTRDSFAGGTQVNLPPVEFAGGKPPEGRPPHPIAAAMQSTRQSVAQPLDIRLRHPRPVYLAPGLEAKLPHAAEFLFTGADSWNESFPFGTVRQRDARSGDLEPPRFSATRNQDPRKGTREEERRGPFPIAVAVETGVPPEWADDRKLAEGFTALRAASGLSGLLGRWPNPLDLLAPSLTATARTQARTQLRVGVIGQGGVFAGKELSPATQALLLASCNWLLHRDDKLPLSPLPAWSYPRVELTESERFYWHWGTFIGLPLLFAYLGVLVLLFRRGR